MTDDAKRNFFKHVRNFGTIERLKQFDVCDLIPGKTDEQAAEILGDYFNAVSNEFEPLDHDVDVPSTYESGVQVLERFEVSGRIRRFRKPKSIVPGDVFPQLMTQFSDFFAIPLTSIYNSITCTKVWPRAWKKEFVTVIPKKTPLESLADLRNISCTMLASKIYES